MGPPKRHISKMQSSLRYKIYLTNPSGEEVHTHTDEQRKRVDTNFLSSPQELFFLDCCSRQLTLHLQHKQKYCVQAQTQIVLQAKSSARSPLTCVSTL